MPLIGGFRFESPTLMSLFDLLFLEARAEMIKKISLVFMEIWTHQKDISKIIGLLQNADLCLKDSCSEKVLDWTWVDMC